MPNTVTTSVEESSISLDPVVAKKDHQFSNSQTVLLIQGMSCVACVARVEKALLQVPEVKKVQVNLADNSALILGNTSSQNLIQAVQEAGYGAELIENEASRKAKQQASLKAEINRLRWQSWLAVGFSAVLMLISMLVTHQYSAIATTAWAIVGVGVVVGMWLCGRHFYCKAWLNLRHGTTSMDTLIALGTLSAWSYSMLVVLTPNFFPSNARHLYFDASLMIIGLINFGKYLELKGKQKSSQALDELLNLTPATTIVITKQGDKTLPVEQLQKNMLIRLSTGSRVPVDGVVMEGTAWIDESMLSGELNPVIKEMNSSMTAGTLITDGSVVLRAEKVGSATRLAQIINLVRVAQSSKPSIGQLADKIVAIFVPVVMTIAILSALVWYLVGVEPRMSYALVAFTSVLIIACPCALGLATPMSIIAGVTRSAQLGVLVRNSEALQKASQINCVVFDKTGTLTQGKPQIQQIFTFNNFSENQILQLSASLEQGVNHPFSQAIIKYAQAQNLSLLSLANLRNLAGFGITGDVDGKQLTVGNAKLMQQQQVDLGMANFEEIQGTSLIYVAINKQLAGIIAIADQVRNNAYQMVAQLHQLGCQVIMLTGDQVANAQFIAKQVGIEEVRAGLLPEDKGRIVQELQQQGKKVLMVGDGINDSLALAQADVSIAIGEGSDIAIETADLTLINNNIESIVQCLSLSKAVMRNIKENLFFAFVYNIICIPLASGVFYPILGILINPMFGAVAMMCSSVSVVLNANRLLKFKF